MSSAVGSVGRFFTKAADSVIGAAETLVSPIVGAKNAALLSDPLGIGPQPEAPAPAPAPEPAPATAPEAPATGAAATDLLGGTAKVDTPVPTKAAPPANDAQVREDEPAQPNQRAAAAGVVKTDNQAGQLGFVAPKKRSASRSILG